jgi:hypothetical protein
MGRSAGGDGLGAVVAGLYRLAWSSSWLLVTGWSGNCGPLATGRPPVAWLAAAATVSVGAANQLASAGHDRHVERSRRRLRIAQLIERCGRGPCSLGPRRLRRQSQVCPACHAGWYCTSRQCTHVRAGAISMAGK